MLTVTNSSTYGKCRCCMAKGNHQHNIYREDCVEMFKKHLNIFLITDPRLTQLVCLACLTFVKDVCRFREMVTGTERQLLRLVNKETVFVDVPADSSAQNELDIKEELRNVKIEEECKDSLDSSLFNSEKITIDNIENKNVTTLKSEIETASDYLSDMDNSVGDVDNAVKNEDEESMISINFCVTKDMKIVSETSAIKRGGAKAKSTRKRKKNDSESDTPISQIKEKKAKVKRKTAREEMIEQTPATVTRTHSKQESLKDNNKIRSNIILILKHSTVLPFRNNFRTSYKCFYCDNSYIPFKELKHHILTEHTDICESIIDKELRTLQDLILTADISCIKCRLCDEEFKSIEFLTEHLTNVHDKVYYDTLRKPSHGILGFDLSMDNLKCHLCNKDFTFFKNLSMHMNEHYGLFVCYVCGKKFISEHRYKCHVFNHHENKTTKCKHCGDTFKTEASMAYHIKKEHIKPSIKCLKCSETFPFSQYIKRLNHMAVVHGIKKPVFKCDTCGREYANSGSLAAHKRYTHKRTKEHRCDICGYITVHNTVMKSHMDVHNGVKNYECEFCKKKFAKPYTLKLHLKIHLNDKRFVCPLCDAAFIQKNSLKNHLKARHPDSGIDIGKL